MDGWTLLIAAHASGALLALVLGTVMVVRRKGDQRHRRIGRAWMVLMYWVVLSSFGITRLNPGHLSWIHGLSAFTFLSLTMAWRAARRGDVQGHRGWAIGSYAGLLGAFAGAVAVPIRLVPRTVVHQPVIAAVAGAVIGLVAVVIVRASGKRLSRRTRSSQDQSHERAVWLRLLEDELAAVAARDRRGDPQSQPAGRHVEVGHVQE
jgi:uncharacterized membrane protein